VATFPDTPDIATALEDHHGSSLLVNRAVTRLRQLHQLGAVEEQTLSTARATITELATYRDQLHTLNVDLAAQVETLTAEKAALQAQLDALTPDDPASVRAAAITTLMTSTTPSDVATRAFIRDLYTAINDVREALSLSRQTEETILPRVIAGVHGGLGDPIPPDALPGNGG
jgi:hypothetical protein